MAKLVPDEKYKDIATEELKRELAAREYDERKRRYEKSVAEGQFWLANIDSLILLVSNGNARAMLEAIRSQKRWPDGLGAVVDLFEREADNPDKD